MAEIWGAAVAGVVGAGISAYGANSAANKQQQGANASIAEQQRQYDTTRNDNAPALEARNNALAQMQNLAGTYKSGPSQQDVLNSPGYQFGLTQGLRTLNNNAAATGGLYSGNQLKAAAGYGTDYATTKYDDQLNNLRNAQNDQFNRYASISGQGQIGANAINQAGQNMANQNSATYMQNGSNQGAAQIGIGNSLVGGLNQVAGWWNTRPGRTAQPDYSYGGGSSYMGQNLTGFGGNSSWTSGSGDEGAGRYDFARADGGPVTHAAVAEQRQEPVVGTRSPLPTGTSGGLSKQAILDAIIDRRAKQVMGRDGVAGLNANPVTHPAAITADRMQRADFAHGGPALGGPPGRDTIPAHLNNGEHVVTTPEVNALGHGSNELGQIRMAQLRKAILAGAH